MMTLRDLARYRERFFDADTAEDMKALLDEVVARYPDPKDVRARSFGSELAQAIVMEKPELLGLEPDEKEKAPE